MDTNKSLLLVSVLQSLYSDIATVFLSLSIVFSPASPALDLKVLKHLEL